MGICFRAVCPALLSEPTGALTSWISVLQIDTEKIVWIFLYALLSSFLSVDEKVDPSFWFLALLSILLFLRLGCGFFFFFNVTLIWKSYCQQMLPKVPYIDSSALPNMEDPEPVWTEGRLNPGNRNFKSFRDRLKTDFTKNMMSAEVTHPNLQ